MKKKKFVIELTDNTIYKLLEIIDNESDLCDCFWYEDQNTIGSYDENGKQITMSLSEYLSTRLENIIKGGSK